MKTRRNLFTDGWKGNSRDYGCFMHFEVKDDGKIWLRRDGTDLNVVNLTCDKCEHAYQQMLTLDMSSFFAVAS